MPPPPLHHHAVIFDTFSCSFQRYLGSRGGAVVRALASHQCGLGSIPGPGVICGLSLLLVLLAPRGFSLGTPVFLPPPPPLPHQCGPGSIPGPGVICGLSLLLVLSLLREVFLRVLRFSPLNKNQHYQIPIRSGFQGPQVCQS